MSFETLHPLGACTCHHAYTGMLAPLCPVHGMKGDPFGRKDYPRVFHDVFVPLDKQGLGGDDPIPRDEARLKIRAEAGPEPTFSREYTSGYNAGYKAGVEAALKLFGAK
jgi:hypothetical protein